MGIGYSWYNIYHDKLNNQILFIIKKYSVKNTYLISKIMKNDEKTKNDNNKPFLYIINEPKQNLKYLN